MTFLDVPLADDVTAIAEQIWASLLDAETLYGPSAPLTDDAVRSATITISGPTNMLVAVATSAAGAVRLTRFLLEVPEPSADDIADALGELVNVLGGNIKSLLPGPSTLSLPVAMTGTVTPPSTAVEQTRVDAAWNGHPVTIVTHTLSPQGERTS